MAIAMLAGNMTHFESTTLYLDSSKLVLSELAVVVVRASA